MPNHIDKFFLKRFFTNKSKTIQRQDNLSDVQHVNKNFLHDYNSITFNGIYNRGGSLYSSKDGETLLKLCYDTEYDRLVYFKDLQIKENITSPLEIYASDLKDYSSAYTMNFYQDAKTLDHLDFYSLSSSVKKQIIFDFFQLLKKLHQFIVLGDIHMHNLLVYQNRGLCCDWDSYRKLDEEFMVYSPYYINNGPSDQTPYTDTVKLLICCLSFYFNDSFETLLKMDCVSFINIFHVIMKEYPQIAPHLDVLINEFFNGAEFSSFDFSSFLEDLPEKKEDSPSLVLKVLKLYKEHS